MPRPKPHPLALFSLVPLNERAEAVVAHQSNEHLVSYLPGGRLALDIGQTRSASGDNATLATLGRNGDVVMEGSSIAKIQGSFEIDLTTSVVMFYDRSHGQTSQVFGEHAIPFEYGRARKVVVQDNINTIIGMGGMARNLIKFELEWQYSSTKVMEMMKCRENITATYQENPRLARTVDDADTVLPSRRETRTHTAGHQQPNLRYARVAELGCGQFGDVHKAVDVDSGKLMAVKILRRPTGASEQDWRNQLHSTLKREVDILSRISHPHIVDYIGSRGWDQGEVEIFMGLKEGTLQSLVKCGCPIPISDLGTTLFHHMLQAIDFLAMEGVVHRDLKPENILYVSRPGQYHFQLGDFGLSNHQITAATFVGSLLYMAPEMFRRKKQTTKADVWSLYVTMLWTLDVEGFRGASKLFETPDEARAAILSVASTADSILVIQEMARPEPEERASAAQMLVKCYNGQGLTTPRNEVPPLIKSAEANNIGPSYTSAAPKQRTHFRKDKNQPPNLGAIRIQKARNPQAAQQGQLIGAVAGKLPSQRHKNSFDLRIPGGFPTYGAGSLRVARRRSRFT